MEKPQVNKTQLLALLAIHSGDPELGFGMIENFIQMTACEYAKDSLIEFKNNVIKSIEQ